ncbi:hypothetical protein SEVIR_7G078700v4 [Setaria viridis]
MFLKPSFFKHLVHRSLVRLSRSLQLVCSIDCMILKVHMISKVLHNSTKQKYSLVKEAFNSLKMLPNELANDMYSYLNVIINKLGAIGLTKLNHANVTRKIIHVLFNDKCASIIVTYFH